LTFSTKPGLFRQMLRIRMVEEAVANRYADGEMRCPVHLSIGQEAIAAGVSAALRPDDMVISNHRSHAHYLAKGGDLKRMLAELHGRETGCARGRGGSMHLIDRSAGMIGALPIVAGSIPIGVGVALASRRAGHDRVVVVYVGDAAIEEGVFHESANFASLESLPVLFVCENNQFSVYTPLATRQPDRPLRRLAEAHGIRTFAGDGNDAREVLDLTAGALAGVRSGAGPAFIELPTYRWREHCGPAYDDDLGYRPAADAAAWRARCPVDQERRRLTAEGQLSAAAEAALTADIAREIEEAFAFALSSPLPDPAAAGAYVYAAAGGLPERAQ
jgi:TPP-dependent pyruvate/acetoin dehydrogenase alpha subunit